MKTQLAKVITLFVCLTLCLSSVYAQKKADGKLKGTWNYALPDAPYGYQEGSIEFKEADGKQTAVVKIGSQTINIKEIKKAGDEYKCSLFVDGADVDVTFKPGTDKITGMVSTDGWEMPLTLTPKK